MWSALCVFSCDSPLVEEENGFGMDGHVFTACNSVIIICSMYGKRVCVCCIEYQRTGAIWRIQSVKHSLTPAHTHKHTYCSYICRTPCAFHTPMRSFIFHHQRLVNPNRCKRSNDSIHTAVSYRRPPRPVWDGSRGSVTIVLIYHTIKREWIWYHFELCLFVRLSISKCLFWFC